MNRVASKVVIVTGGAVGIGRASVIRLAEQGAAVAIFDRDDQEGQALADALTKKGLKAGFWHVDVAKESDVKSAMDAVVARFGGLHVLVNNAGIIGSQKLMHEITEAEWDQVQAVNVKGVVFCNKHALPHMKKAGGGSVINLSSIAGMIGTGAIPAYHASKGALRVMTKNDAVVYAPDHIRFNSIHPGYIWTPMVQGFMSSAPDAAAARQAADTLHPLGHMGEPDDIAWAVVYLASDESKFMTGAELVIDGGYTAR